jgi:hypothetical protein
MLDRNQSTRISIHEVIEHIWINSNTSLHYIVNTSSSIQPKNDNSNNTILNQSTYLSTTTTQNESKPRFSDTQTNKIVSRQSKNYKPTKNVLAPL